MIGNGCHVGICALSKAVRAPADAGICGRRIAESARVDGLRIRSGDPARERRADFGGGVLSSHICRHGTGTQELTICCGVLWLRPSRACRLISTSA